MVENWFGAHVMSLRMFFFLSDNEVITFNVII